MATWTPPPRPPPTTPPPPPTLRPGCSASVAGDGGWGSGWAQASRGGSGGWKVGEVSCGCFLFTAAALRGAGSGCLLTVLGKGGEGREFRRANHTPSDRMKRQEARERQETDRERRHFLCSVKPAQKEEPKKGHKTT